MTWIRAVALWLFVMGIATSATSQLKLNPEIINYPNTVYQAQSQNWSVTQDENDFLFFGNNEGLLTYNGARWQLFPLPGNQILRCVAADQHGKIYAGGFGTSDILKNRHWADISFIVFET